MYIITNTLHIFQEPLIYVNMDHELGKLCLGNRVRYHSLLRVDHPVPIGQIQNESVHEICTVDAKITCRYSHRSTIVQRCNRTYKTAIKRHSVKRTTGFVRPYYFLKTVCNSYHPYYPYG